jgi:hypothetical protein
MLISQTTQPPEFLLEHFSGNFFINISLFPSQHNTKLLKPHAKAKVLHVWNQTRLDIYLVL